MASQPQTAQELVRVYQIEAERNVGRCKNLLELMYHTPEAQVGLTPKEVIWTKNKAKLYHMLPVVPNPHPIPILVTYALINRPYILDLYPGNSMVEFLVNAGFDVYILDWGYPGPEDSSFKFENYILDYMSRALNKVLKDANASQVNLLGYCMGGTLTAIFAALQEKGCVNKMSLLASPIDFTRAGLYSVWLNKKNFNIDLLVDTMGNIPAELIDFGNKMLKPVVNYISPSIRLWDNMWNKEFLESFRPLNKWINDGTPFPGEAYRQWIKDFYQENKLVTGRLFLRGKLVDLSKISCPVLIFAGTRDHIVPAYQSNNFDKFISSENYEYVELDTGHVSLVVGKTAQRKVWPKLAEWFKPC